MNETPKTMSSKRNILILVIVLAVVIIGGIIAAVAVGTSGGTDITKTLTLAERYLDEEDYEQAIIEFEHILEIDPMNVDAYIGKAKALIALGDEDEAAQLLQEAYELTGSEEIKAMLDVFSESDENKESADVITTTEVQSSVQTSTTAAATVAPEPAIDFPELDLSSVQMADFPYEDEYCHSIETMLFNHIYYGAELDAAMLSDVTSLQIKGASVFVVKCGESTGTVVPYNMPYFTLEHTVEFQQPKSEYGNIPETVTTSFGYLENIDFLKYMTSLSSLEISGNGIADASGLMHCTNLTELHIMCDTIADIAPVSDLKQLTYLQIVNSNVTDLSAFAGMTEIKTLILQGIGISDISVLSDMKKLWYLDLGYTDVSDITPLTGLQDLSILYLQSSVPVSDLSPLYTLPELRTFVTTSLACDAAQIDALKAALPECDITCY